MYIVYSSGESMYIYMYYTSNLEKSTQKAWSEAQDKL